MRVNKKMRKGALRSALTDALQSGKLAVVDGLVVRGAQDPAGGRAARRARAHRQGPRDPAPAHRGRRHREVVPEPAPACAWRYAGGLGTYDLLWADRVLFTAAALDALEGREVGAGMKSPRDVILRPIVSEKSYAGLERKTYTFLVDPRANKTEIKEAIQAIWDVRVISVNTLNRPRQGEAARLHEGQAPRPEARHRDPGRGRLHRDLRERELGHGRSQVQADDPGTPWRERLVVRGDHPRDAREVARRQGAQQGRAQRARSHHDAPPGRREQAAATA